MDAVRYQRFLDELTGWAEHHPDVVGLVALGSTAAVGRKPDRWSDHDVWVVVRDGTAEGFRTDTSWLPDPDRIALAYRETAHGGNVIYEDGHFLEFAVFDEAELDIVAGNDARVLVDRADVAARLEGILGRNSAEPESADTLLGKVLGQVWIGVSRFGRGERQSAHAMVKTHAWTSLLHLVTQCVPSEGADGLDDLDVTRRFELAYPNLAARIEAALAAPLLDCAQELLEIAREVAGGALVVVPDAAFDAVLGRVEEAAR